MNQKIIITNAFAALLMFCSWAMQNIYMEDHSSTKIGILEKSQFVTSEMGTALQWMLTFQKEISSGNPNLEFVLNSAQGYVNSFESILTAAVGVDPESKILQNHLEKFTEQSAKIRKAAKERKLDEIIDRTKKLMSWIKSIDSEAQSEIQAKYKEVVQKEDMFTRWFRFTHILAAIIFAITWWKLNKDKIWKKA